MARPQKITDREILEAARRCFLEHGPHASCERIAEDLGVSSAALFKRFGTKENLQRVALTPVPPAWLDELLQGPAPDLPVRDQLLDLGGKFLFFFRDMLPCVFALRAAGNAPDFAGEGATPPPVKAQRSLAAWVAAAQRDHRIAFGDPLVVAQAFIGGLMARAVLEHLGGIPEREDPQFLARLIDTLWSGIQPPVPAPSSSPSSSPPSPSPSPSPSSASPASLPRSHGPEKG